MCGSISCSLVCSSRRNLSTLQVQHVEDERQALGQHIATTHVATQRLELRARSQFIAAQPVAQQSEERSLLDVCVVARQLSERSRAGPDGTYHLQWHTVSTRAR